MLDITEGARSRNLGPSYAQDLGASKVEHRAAHTRSHARSRFAFFGRSNEVLF
jgi:hypothetical protein